MAAAVNDLVLDPAVIRRSVVRMADVRAHV